MADTYEAVQRALVAKLTAALAPFSCPVFDYGPENQAMPYLLTGSHTTDPSDTFGEVMTIHRIVLGIFAGPNQGSTGAVRGKSQARRITEAARNALHHAKLALDAGTCVRCEVERVNIDLGNDVATADASLIVRIDVAE